MQFVGGQPGSGRPRKPRVIDEFHRLVEEHARVVAAPFFQALGLELHEDGSVTDCEGAVIVAKYEGEVHTSDVPDLGARMTAARELLDRVSGKPRQAVELQGASETDAPPVQIVAVDDKKAAAAAHDFLARIARERG